MSTIYSVGQMNQLGDALEAAGFTPDDVTKLRSFPELSSIKDILAGHAQIITVKHIIDLNAAPSVPKNWQVEEHIKGGKFEWDSAKVALYLSKNQQDDKIIEGNQLRKEMKGKPVFNANLLDYLLAHPELIPESWKVQYVFFWGTIYRGPRGGLYVRYLGWGDGGWDWHFGWLGGGFGGPAAVPASS